MQNKLARFIDEKVYWSRLRGLRDSALVKNMAIWLVVIPVITRTLANAPEHITFQGTNFSFALQLPFSWQLFYFSAVLFVAANLTFLIAAPRIVSRYGDFSTFQNQGRGLEHLEWYNWQIGGHAKPPSNLNATDTWSCEIELKGYFWEIHTHANVKSFPIRVLTGLLYLLGFGLMLIVGLQSLMFVIASL